MSFSLIATVFFALVAVGAFVVFRTQRSHEVRVGAWATAIVSALLTLLFLGVASTTIVSTRNVGVVTQFGRPVGTLSNGLHFHTPLQRVTELSGVIHTNNQVGGWGGDGKCSGSTAVRLANKSTACVDNTIRWRIVPEQADSLFRDYRDDDNIRDSLVTRELNATLNAVFAGFNPLVPDAASLESLSKTVTDQLTAKIGKQIEVQNVIVTLVHVDRPTQERIDALQVQIASTQIATEAQRTATAQAEANRILADSVSRDPNVLVARCLDLVGSGKPLPAGFQCWPGNGIGMSVPVR